MPRPRVSSFSLASSPSSPSSRSSLSTASASPPHPLVVHCFLPSDPALGPLPLCPVTLELLLYRRLFCVHVEFVWERRVSLFSPFLPLRASDAAAEGGQASASLLTSLRQVLHDPALLLGSLLDRERRETRAALGLAQPPWALDGVRGLLAGKGLREEVLAKSAHLQSAEPHSPTSQKNGKPAGRRDFREGRGRRTKTTRQEPGARPRETLRASLGKKRAVQIDDAYACLVEVAVSNALEFYLWNDEEVFSNFTLPLLTHSLGPVSGRVVAFVSRASRLCSFSLAPSSLPSPSPSPGSSSTNTSSSVSSVWAPCRGEGEQEGTGTDAPREDRETDKDRGDPEAERKTVEREAKEAQKTQGERRLVLDKHRRSDEAVVLKGLRETLNALASLLQQRGNVFFGGREGKPSLLDIRAFVFLSILFSIPLPDRWDIEQVLLGSAGSSVLVQFCLRMHGAFPVWPGDATSFLFGVRSSVAARTISRETMSLSPQLDALCRYHSWRREEKTREEKDGEASGKGQAAEGEEWEEGRSESSRWAVPVHELFSFARPPVSLYPRSWSAVGCPATVICLALLALYAARR
ncbi:conserved hypothetical protein [Neospora caninum Liverpool]|uniref:Metaxin glutathione S-transferase domain-containing protein n=1 Tax=Neospora caninum (strain Liverpool) TaxID=572307 RepID=F0VHF5_NEOCL|nr:conserved hypothetical protein [Neospora caninum Liverpool]CBZ53149.1 conserved hypothetical protein [Neospora caninum Liverpool]CEL67140.1 TPA: hypothetical protein BN1204_029360 [Neospora caninum Liverpool]|eukprot:XP_003883181.1 conserved hypothetical protein [Neospora caninum Liverpool]